MTNYVSWAVGKQSCGFILTSFGANERHWHAGLSACCLLFTEQMLIRPSKYLSTFLFMYPGGVWRNVFTLKDKTHKSKQSGVVCKNPLKTQINMFDTVHENIIS